MASDDLWKLDATAQAELVRARRITPLELVDAAIARIERLNPTLNAVIHEHFERARREARGTLPDGPLRGVPFLLKDLGGGYAKGDPLYWGTRFLRDADYRAPTSAYLVDKFRRAGLVIVGRTNVPELGAWATTEPASFGPCRNPWNPAYTSGGSSGGAAVAVASGMVPVAHASDGGGSIRNPASQCGVVGLKPTRGRISLGPAIGEFWNGMAIEFAVSRSVRDTAVLLDAVEGPMPGDPYGAVPPERPYVQELGRPAGRLQVGVLAQREGVLVHPDCVEAAERAARALADLGHTVNASHPPEIASGEIDRAAIAVVASNQARDVERFGEILGRELGPDDMDSDNWAITMLGREVSAARYLGAIEQFHHFQRRVAAWWADGHDLLLTPTITAPPPRLGDLVPDPATPLDAWTRTGQLLGFTLPFNVTGQPAISLPLHWNAAGLPIGVQLVAAFGREDVLIRVAAQLEAALPWQDRWPGVHP
jgi:amidase